MTSKDFFFLILKREKSEHCVLGKDLVEDNLMMLKKRGKDYSQAEQMESSAE